ncbi:MAG TPA: hypothetical protein VN132_01485, partial [Bdellovibrio sp.]|nr:hypothetical protein [Bdellovibrio sp.]
MKYSILLLLFLTACSSQFREPVCTNYLTSFPEEFKGSYELTMPTNSAEWSGNFILKTNRVEIIDKTTDFSEAMKGMPGSGALCKINNRYFTEVQNANGTYSLTEVVPFPQGLLFSALQLDIDKAHQQGLKLHY